MKKLDIKSFEPIVDTNSYVLILGSIPSVKSLEEMQYYAHPQNAFWFIMSELFHFERKLEYNQRLEILLKNRIALYDVIGSCERAGSLDSAIKNAKHQDFEQFFQKHSNIKHVFCNGGKAYSEFTKIYKGDKSVYKLPSTSPAFAKMKKEEKLEEWKIITKVLSEL
ncbi:MAG: DNA-deoxyinosine glycosylase [Sulfurospirillaceae bacterium]|nr:DNA-deoxyinosine glycosylase [Sulfurospirillaceae bacterium]